VSPFEGDREWEKPRRFEAYPTLRTRVSMGMPGMPRVGRFPPVLLAAIALALAAGALFMLPSFLPGPDSGGSVVSPSAGSSASAGPTVTAAPTPTPAPTPVVYIVKRGDTFSAIARRHGVTMDALKAANPQIVNINALQIGDRVNIPDPDATPSVGTSPVLSPDASPGDETDLPGTPEP
jgi:LysM repeat protein